VKRPGLSPALSAAIGGTALIRGRLRGTTGFELERDAELRGRYGMFEVMVDKRGRWIPGTWREVFPARPGKDSRLTISTHEAEEISRKKHGKGL